MRQAYAHEAHLILKSAADELAPGEAITAALHGDQDHEPPHPLAAHHTATTRDGETLSLRILFATAPDKVDTVRDRIDSALAAGHFTGPDGTTTHWQPLTSGCTRIAPDDRPQARHLLTPSHAETT